MQSKIVSLNLMRKCGRGLTQRKMVSLPDLFMTDIFLVLVVSLNACVKQSFTHLFWGISLNRMLYIALFIPVCHSCGDLS